MTKHQIIEAIREARQEGHRSTLIYNDLTANLKPVDTDLVWRIIYNSDESQDVEAIVDKIYESKKKSRPKNMENTEEKYMVMYSSADDHVWIPQLNDNTEIPILYSSIKAAHQGFNEFIDDMYNSGEIDPEKEHQMHIFKLATTKNFKIKIPQVELQFT